jgi:maltoporin
MVAFQAPGAWAKYRLGNEAETYGEALLRYNYPAQEDSPASWNVQLRLAMSTDQDIGFPGSDRYSLPEAFVQGKDVVEWLPGASFWAGAHFYRRVDIHINDFKLSDARGYGGGVEDIDLGFGKFALMYMGSNKDDIKLDAQRLTKRVSTCDSMKSRFAGANWRSGRPTAGCARGVSGIWSSPGRKGRPSAFSTQ